MKKFYNLGSDHSALEWVVFCFVRFNSLRPINKSFSYKGTGVPGLNQY